MSTLFAPDLPALLNAGETATLLNISRSMVYKLIAEGALPAVRIGTLVRIPAAGLRDWLEQQQYAR